MGSIPSSLWHKIGIPTPPCSILSKTIGIVPVTIGHYWCALFLKWDHMSRWTTIRVWPQSNSCHCLYIYPFSTYFICILFILCILYVVSSVCLYLVCFQFLFFCILYFVFSRWPQQYVMVCVITPTPPFQSRNMWWWWSSSWFWWQCRVGKCHGYDGYIRVTKIGQLG